MMIIIFALCISIVVAAIVSIKRYARQCPHYNRNVKTRIDGRCMHQDMFLLDPTEYHNCKHWSGNRCYWKKQFDMDEVINYFEKHQANNRKCAACGKLVRPLGGRGGMRFGAAAQLLAIPKIEEDNAFICEKCGATICPVCSGNKASTLGVSEFVCTQCGHRPIKAIFR